MRKRNPRAPISAVFHSLACFPSQADKIDDYKARRGKGTALTPRSSSRYKKQTRIMLEGESTKKPNGRIRKLNCARAPYTRRESEDCLTLHRCFCACWDTAGSINVAPRLSVRAHKFQSRVKGLESAEDSALICRVLAITRLLEHKGNARIRLNTRHSAVLRSNWRGMWDAGGAMHEHDTKTPDATIGCL